MQHQDCIKVHWGGVPGSQRAEERGLRSTQAGVRYPCASTLGSVRHGSFPWLLRGQLAARPLLPPSKTSHTTLFSCSPCSLPEPRGQDTAHVPHSPTENTVLIATTSGLPSTHGGLHRVWTGLQGVVNPPPPLPTLLKSVEEHTKSLGKQGAEPRRVRCREEEKEKYKGKNREAHAPYANILAL